MPKRLSNVTITCEVTGSRKYSHDLPQGWLEMSCILHLEGDQNELNKLKWLIIKPWQQW